MADSNKTLAFYDMALITVHALDCKVISSVIFKIYKVEKAGAYPSGTPYGTPPL